MLISWEKRKTPSPMIMITWCKRFCGILSAVFDSTEKISINKLTTILGVSQPYLFKIFNKKYNTSLKQYIIDRKLNIAKKMLNKTDMSITQIANSLGYNDPLAFSKLFLTPTSSP